MLKFFKKIVGDINDRAVKQIVPIADEIESIKDEYRALSADQLREMTAEFRARLADGETLDDILPDAFATVREAARRQIGQFHYKVQLIGGIVLHQGKIAEMKTGEGKTLVATLPLYLNALEGKGCHLITVNDYLAKVGAGWMAPIYHMLGLSVGFIAHDYSALFDPEYIDPDANPEDQRLIHWRPCVRREAYAADITYGTNNEFGFDYLRDNMVVELEQRVQRDYAFAIVHEVDNILIDEARTPLIISGQAEESADKYFTFARLVPRLQGRPEGAEEGGDYFIDLKDRAVSPTEEGITKMEGWLGVANMYDADPALARHFEQALKAHALYKRDRDYIVKDGEIVIVDEFTGRQMPGRRWSEGLHQAIEAQEGPRVPRESVTLATFTS